MAVSDALGSGLEQGPDGLARQAEGQQLRVVIAVPQPDGVSPAGETRVARDMDDVTAALSDVFESLRLQVGCGFWQWFVQMGTLA